ncbi:hypothetical protein DPSP01_003594 [Paraphaeosphaeria sporulosa]
MTVRQRMQAWRRHLHVRTAYRDSTPVWPLCSGSGPDCASLGLSQSSTGYAQLLCAIRNSPWDLFTTSGSSAPPSVRTKATNAAEDGPRQHGAASMNIHRLLTVISDATRR